MTMKCKGSDHVDVVALASGGDPVGVWGCRYLAHGACRNDTSYSGALYLLTRNGKDGMQMFPELARIMPARLRDAAAEPGNSVRIRHRRKILGVSVPTKYADLQAAAAEDLALAIEAVVHG